MTRFVLLLFLPHSVFPQTRLAERIDAAINASPDAQRAFVGVQAIDVSTGAVIYQKNADHFFIPASNTKLFSTALALMRLGPDHRMQTRVTADSRPDSNGVLHGDLQFIGGGDTTLSGRTYPYRKDDKPNGNPLQVIETLADEIVAKGVRRVQGDVIGDDTAFVWAPFPVGWAQDDATWEYGAPVSALILNDNAFRVNVKPGANAGDPARIEFSPLVEDLTIHNLVRTVQGGNREINFNRRAGSRELQVWGQIPVSDAGMSELLAIGDPALFAARVLYDALERRGVQIMGRPVARHRFEASVPDLKLADPQPVQGSVELAARRSPPLLEMLRVTNKVSQNLHAETVLRETARVKRGIGSREAGLEELKLFLSEVGVDDTAYFLRDGSGLSRLNLVTPETVAKLLGFMARSAQRDAWISLLPVGGEDGTLGSRFKGTAAAGRVRAKTGSISHVSALSGYLDKADGRLIAFSIFVNNFNGQTSGSRGAIDRIVGALLEP
jgi:D-alanyl-D-alanine carboxypeptidase/D-alanyl-D-alanine-endopeptidase (penicillin-binding protein 4)